MSLPTGTPDELFEQAQAWIEEHLDAAPRDYGAILPPELVDEVVVPPAQEGKVVDVGLPVVPAPPFDVVDLTPAFGDVAAAELACR